MWSGQALVLGEKLHQQITLCKLNKNKMIQPSSCQKIRQYNICLRSQVDSWKDKTLIICNLSASISNLNQKVKHTNEMSADVTHLQNQMHNKKLHLKLHLLKFPTANRSGIVHITWLS